MTASTSANDRYRLRDVVRSEWTKFVSLRSNRSTLLAIAVLGVLTMSSEYSSGSIRTTLAAVPRRMLVLAAKAIVFAGLVFITAELVTFIAFLAGTATGAGAPTASLGDGAVLRALAA